MSRTQSPKEKDINSESEQLRSPSPVPRTCNEECHRSTNAIFNKRWSRGYNTCSRCDFEYAPVRGGRPTRRPEDKLRQSIRQSQQNQPPQVQSRRQTTSGNSLVKEEIREEKKTDVRDIRREDRVPISPIPRKKPHIESASPDAQITSSLMGAAAFPPYVVDHPAFRGFAVMRDPMPALRQLSEYAKPHIGGIGYPERTPSSGSGFDPFNRFPGLYRAGSKDRLDADLEKHRDRLERRNCELWESKDRMKSEMDVKPQDHSPLYPGAGLFDAHLLEMQKRYGSALPPGVTFGNIPPVNLPGVFSPMCLTAEWMRREREQLEILDMGGMVPNLSLADASLLSERLLAEQLQAERLNEQLVLPADPVYRLEMMGLGPAASVVEQSHATHTHSHTHLHLHQPDAAAAAAATLYPSYHPLVASAPHLVPTSGFPLPAIGMNPLANDDAAAAALPGTLSLGPLFPHSPYSFAASQQLMAAARDQDLLYRELLSRLPYCTDPVLAQQLTAQAIAHQEAVERQLEAVERDRLSAALHGSMLPH